jgi:cytochrome c peroxidase
MRVIVLVVAALAQVSALATERVGVGDSREGYDSKAFTTDSRALTKSGRSADLLALVENPPLGLATVPVPSTNPMSADKIALGRKLFFDRRLSGNGTLSCAMCHVPEQGFTQNELTTSVGVEGRFVKRNAPALYNVAYRERLFHDGRENSLETQIWSPILAFNEMANPSVGSVLERLENATDYAGLFEKAFGRGPTMETVGMALAAYERGLLSADSPFDRWYFGGEEHALGKRAKRGFEVFKRSGCASCHTFGEAHAQFTDEQFHDTGIGYYQSVVKDRKVRKMVVAPGVEVDVKVDAFAPQVNDVGRYEATGKPEDRWKYRTPTLRNVAVTAPYMHDGSLATLEEVIAHYNDGGVLHDGLDPRVHPLGLGRSEISDLVAFLESLTGSNVDRLAEDARSTRIGDF